MEDEDGGIAFEDQIRESYGRVVYTHKTHMCMADRQARIQRNFKIGQVVLSALTSAGVVGVIASSEAWVEYLTAAISFLTLFTAAYLKNMDPGAVAQAHRDVAARIWNVRENYLSLLTDLPTLGRADAASRRDELQTSLAAIYQSAPQTDGKAYAQAQERLQKMEDMTFSAEEIDCFLPYSLKRSGGRKLPD